MRAIAARLRATWNTGSAGSRRIMGAALMAVAMLTIPCADGIGKYLSADHSPLFLSWARYAAGAAFIVPTAFMAGKGDRIPRQQVPLQLLRAILNVGSVSFYYLAIARIPLADALGAYFIAPILATLLAAIFLKEALYVKRLLAVAVGFAGALLIAQPGVTMNLGMVYALAAGCGMACYIVTTRALAQASSPLATLVSQYVSGGVLLLIPALLNWSAPKPEALLLILLMGFVSATSHLLVITAFSLAEASALSPLIYLELVGTTIFGLLVFGQLPSWTTWLGIGLVVAGGLGLIERRQR